MDRDPVMDQNPFAELSDKATADQVIFTGGPTEQPPSADVCGRVGRGVRAPLAELVALFYG